MRFIPKLLVAIIVLTPLSARAADSNATVFTDPQEAGFDFAAQGEYAGELQMDDGPQKFGAQVIALGDGKFRIVGYPGGLPGAGWSREDQKYPIAGERQGDAVVFTAEDEPIRVVLESGIVKVFSEGFELGQMKKVARKSPTLGAKPPQDAVVLFDGSGTDAWDNGTLTQDKYLAATGVSTKQKFDDHHLHIEFRTPFMPTATGQGRGNSGVYVQSRYEVQVLDSFGLEGENNECGGIYSIAEPDVNMCLPPLTWQTYDIDFTAARYNEDGEKVKNARATIKHNGVVIHDDLELTHGTPGRHPEEPGPDALFLQHHGNPVVFRNIWVVPQ